MNCNLKYFDTTDYVLEALPKFGVENYENYTAITTSSGILILELHPNLEESTNYVTHYKLFIKSSTYMLIEQIESNIATFLFYLPQDSVYHCLFQSTLTGHLDNIKKKTFTTTRCSWSPAKLVGEQNVISTINDAGSLDLYVKVSNINGIIKFEHLLNATEVHIAKFKWKWIDVTKKTPQESYEETLKRVSLHTPKVMTWTHLMQQKVTAQNKKSVPLVYSVLIVAYADGRIVFWQFNHVSMEKRQEAKVSFLGEYETDMEDVTALHWHPSNENLGMLIIGDKNGKTIALPVLNLVMNYFEVDEPILLSELTDMAVDYLDVEVKSDYLFIYVVLQSHLVIYALDKDGKIVQSADYNCRNINITGFQKTVNDTIIITTVTGAVKEMKTEMIDGELQLAVRDIFVNINFSKHILLGFYMSQNNAIVSFITQQSGLLYKGPIHMRLMTYGNQSVDALKIFMEKDFLSDCYDLLEIMRVTSVQNKELLCNKLSPAIQYEDLTMQQLKRYLCIAKISESVFDQVETITHYNIKQATDIQSMINIKLSVYLLRHIVRELKETGALTEYKREVGHLCCTYLKDIVIQGFLEEHNLKNNYVDDILEVLNECDELKLEGEYICKICDAPMLGLTCPSGHLDNRCAFSMVQITNPKYKCPICIRYVAEEALVFHKQLCCPICDSTLDTIIKTSPIVKYECKQFCPEDCLTYQDTLAILK